MNLEGSPVSQAREARLFEFLFSVQATAPLAWPHTSQQLLAFKTFCKAAESQTMGGTSETAITQTDRSETAAPK